MDILRTGLVDQFKRPPRRSQKPTQTFDRAVKCKYRAMDEVGIGDPTFTLKYGFYFMLIGISGKARTGKDTVALYLRDKYNFRTYAFADPLKETVMKMFDVPRSFLEGDKNTPHEFWGFTARDMLQKVGTDCAREMFVYDIWTKHAERQYQKFLDDPYYVDHKLGDPWCDKPSVKSYAGFCLSDVRFTNEIEWIKSKNGVIIGMDRNTGVEFDQHISEKGINQNSIDFCILNNGSLDDLYLAVDGIMKQLGVTKHG